jgi:protein TonB
MSQRDRFAPVGGVSRNAVIVGSVVMLHVAGLWALQSGLLRRAAEVIVPAELLSEFIAPPAPRVAPPAPSAPARIEMPSSDAAYLNNPKPGYPAISKRMGEQGKVVLRVLIGTDGLPQKVEINKSSGYDRLDRQAQEAVMRWRFVPGKRNGVPEAMWSLVPINFVLE